MRSNFHTHTVFCDGKDSPEAMAERALELGCDIAISPKEVDAVEYVKV